MTSLRQDVFEYIQRHPRISLSKLKREFKEYNGDTIKRYLTQYREINNGDILGDINIKDELIKIIKDYKQPASSRVQAIREYTNLVETQPEDGDDPYLKFKQALESKNSGTKTIADSS